MVVVYHSCFYAREALATFKGVDKLVFAAISYLWLGVPIFFVISGYCISATCDTSRRKQHSVREYLWRRYRRIFPPFWILVAISVVIVWTTAAVIPWTLFNDKVHPIAHPTSLSLSQWFGNLTLTESWRHFVFGSPHQYFLGHAWSLCYEEQFYIVCGVLLFVTPARFFRNALFVSLGVTILSFAAFITGIRTVGFFFDGRWLMFALGILVYWIINYATDVTARNLRRVVTITAVIAFLSLAIRPVRHLFLAGLGIELVAALLFSAVLLQLRPHDTSIMTSRLLFPITWCGSMCYSLYLSHWTFVKPLSNWLWHNGADTPRSTLFLTIPACLLISVAVARVFYILVEHRFLNTTVEVRAAAARA